LPVLFIFVGLFLGGFTQKDLPNQHSAILACKLKEPWHSEEYHSA